MQVTPRAALLVLRGLEDGAAPYLEQEAEETLRTAVGVLLDGVASRLQGLRT